MKIQLRGLTPQLKTISSRQRLPLPDGTFQVLNAWDEQPSDYTVTVFGGKLVSAETVHKGDRVNLGDAWRYLTSPANRQNRLGQLLDALAASTSNPGAGPGREEEFMLGGQSHDS